MLESFIPTIIKEGIGIVSDLIKTLNKKGVTKIEERKKDKAERIRLETSEVESSLEYHINFVRKWSKEITFRDLNSPKVTSKVHVKLDFFLTPRKLQIEEETSLQINLDDIFSKKDTHVVILGHPGAGKTTSMKYLAHQILSNVKSIDFNIPIVIRLRELRKKKIKTIDAEHLVTIHLLEKLLEITGIQIYLKTSKDEVDDYKLVDSLFFETNLPLIKKILIPFIDSLKALIILDGLDEVSINNKERIVQQTRELTLRLSNSKIILTSRTGDFNYDIENTIEYEISPLSKSQIQEFSTKWLVSEEKSREFYSQILNSPFADTAIRPLTLAHLCTIFDRYKKIPEKPKTIYRKVVNLLIEEWDIQRSVTRDSRYSKFEIDRKFEFICNLSYYLTTKHQATVFNHTDFVNAYRNICDNFNLPDDEASKVADEIEAHTGLLFQSSYEKFEFAHKSIQEYLAAEHLAKLPSIPYDRIILIIPNELAIALTISSNPTIYFATLVFENLKRFDISQVFIDTFLNRILIERPDFSVHPLWALTFLKLFTISYSKDLNMKIFDSIASLKNSKISLAKLGAFYRIGMKHSSGIVEIIETNYLNNDVFTTTPKKLLSKSDYLIEWINDKKNEVEQK